MNSFVSLGYAQALARQMLAGVATVERRQPDGSWLVVGNVDCAVLPRKATAARHDGELGDASAGDYQEADVQVAFNAEVRIADRLTHDGVVWVIGADDEGKTNPAYRGLVGARQVVAVAPEQVTFVRIDPETDAVTTLGPFTVQVVLDRAVPRDATGEAAATRTVTGTVIGPAGLPVLVGDSFMRDGLPATVTHVPPPVGDRREVRFRIERGVV